MRVRRAGILKTRGTVSDDAGVNPFEELAAAVYEDVAVTEVIRPSAVLPESAARAVLVELAMRDVRQEGVWASSPTLWQRYDRPWDGVGDEPGTSELIGSLHVTQALPDVSSARGNTAALSDCVGVTGFEPAASTSRT